MDIISIVQERLDGPEWAAFLEALPLAAAERPAGETAFWRAIDYAMGPLYDGITEEDGQLIEDAVLAELRVRLLVDQAGRMLAP